MKKFKRLVRRIFSPVPCSDLISLAFGFLLFSSLVWCCWPSLLYDLGLWESFNSSSLPPDVRLVVYMLAGSIGALILVVFFQGLFGLADLLLNWITKRRKGPEAVKDNLIEVYVDDDVYFSVQRMADMAGVSLPVFCDCVLQSLDMDVFIAVREQMVKEVDHGE